MPLRRIRNRVLASRPVRGMIRESKKRYLPGMHRFTLHEVLQGLVRQIRRTSVPERAAAISFNIFMAMPPVLIFVFTLIPHLPISKQFINELFILIRDIVPGEKNNSVIISFLQDFLQKPRNELLSFGLFLALFFSSNAMMGILRAFDKNYEGFRKRTLFTKRKAALGITLVVFIMVFLCVLLLIAQGVVLKWIGIENDTLRNIITETRWIVIFIIVFITISFIYRHGPPVTRKWPYITPGSVLATTLMIIATLIVSWWINHFSNYNKLYGSISAIFILMSLIYINSLAVLLGFELNVTLGILKNNRDRPAE